MRVYQKLVAPDGYEVALFPMEYLYMSQDEGGDYSHQGTYNIDFLGYSSGGRVFQAPIYAPCTMKVVATMMNYTGGNCVIFESINPVHLANGQVDYLTISFAHDSAPPITIVGAIVQQGEICYHTGTYGNVTGDHVHSCCGQGHYQGFTDRGGHQDLTNRIHYWDATYINDTIIVMGYNHDWKIFENFMFKKENKFPWVLYASKLRNKSQIFRNVK